MFNVLVAYAIRIKGTYWRVFDMTSMLDVVNKTSRLEQLKALLNIIAIKIDDNPGARDLASLARQYRETLTEIEEIEGSGADEHDELNDILRHRELNGLPGAVRQNRSAV